MRSLTESAVAYYEAHLALQVAERNAQEADNRKIGARSVANSLKKELDDCVGRNQPVKNFLVGGKVVRVQHHVCDTGPNHVTVTVEDLIQE